MRTKRIAILALALFALLATVAYGGFKAGKYKGHTKAKVCVKIVNGSCQKFRKGKISFRVHKKSTGSYLNSTKFEIRLNCSDGSHVNEKVSIGGKLPISNSGKFNGTAPTSGGTGSTKISGKVKGKKAHGKLSRSERLDDQNNEDANGRKCSASTKWSAKKS